LSESIFGPIRDFQCKCGKLSIESVDGGKICDKCGVLCGPSELRLKPSVNNVSFPVIKSTKKSNFKKIIGNQH